MLEINQNIHGTKNENCQALYQFQTNPSFDIPYSLQNLELTFPIFLENQAVLNEGCLEAS